MVGLDAKFFKRNIGKIKKDSNNEISCCCPLCGDAKNRLHLIHVQADNYNYVKCFNSGCEVEEPTSVFNFLIKLNSPDIDAYKREVLQDKISVIKSEFSLNNLLKKVQKPKVEPTPEVSEVPRTNEVEMPLHHFKLCKDCPECLEYVRSRGLEPLADWRFSTEKFFTFNKKNIYLLDYLIVPIYISNKFKGFYSRSIREKSFSTFLMPDVPKLWRNQPTKKPVIITEGIFDALSIAEPNIGAMIGADLSPKIRSQLTDTIFAFDNDVTGTEKAIKFSKEHKVFVWPETWRKYKDFNELLLDGHTKEEIRDTIFDNVYTGIMAETRLRMKD